MIPIAPLVLLLFYNKKIRYEKGPEFYALAFSFIALSIIVTLVTMSTNIYA